MTVLVYFSSENRSDESKQRSQHSASHSNTQWCFEWFSVLNESVESQIQWPMHKHLSHSWWIGRNERLNDSLNKTAYHLHLRSLSTNQSNLFKTLFFLNQSKHILIFIQELCIYKTITFYDSSLVIKKICIFVFSVFFPSHPVAYSRRRAPPVENHCYRWWWWLYWRKQ